MDRSLCRTFKTPRRQYTYGIARHSGELSGDQSLRLQVVAMIQLNWSMFISHCQYMSSFFVKLSSKRALSSLRNSGIDTKKKMTTSTQPVND